MSPFNSRIVLGAALGMVAFLSHGTAGLTVPGPANLTNLAKTGPKIPAHTATKDLVSLEQPPGTVR